MPSYPTADSFSESSPSHISGEPSAVYAPSASRQKFIMVIDDSPLIRTMIVSSFARVGMEAVPFADGLSAISALAKGEVAVPDLVLLDLGLPRMDGYEVAHILKRNADFAQTVIIMLTARDGVFDKVRSRMVGAKDFITKPFRPSELIEKVRTHLDLPPLGLSGTAGGA